MQAALLRHFDVKMAVFRLSLLGRWENDEYTEIANDDDEDSDDDEEQFELP